MIDRERIHKMYHDGYIDIIKQYNTLETLMAQFAEDKFITSETQFISDFHIIVENNQIVAVFFIRDVDATDCGSDYKSEKITFDEFIDYLLDKNCKMVI